MTELADIFPLPPPAPPIEPDLRVSFILSPGFTLLAFAGFIDSLRHAADEADFNRQVHCSWMVMAPDLEPIRASCGVPVTPDELIDEDTEVDCVVVVGGQLPVCLDLPDQTYDYLRAAHAKGTKIVGLCTGCFIIARAGLLDGKSCAVHVEHCNQFQRLFRNVRTETDMIYVDEGGIMTCPGAKSAIDLACALIESHCGKARAVKALTSMLVDRHRTAHHLPHRMYGHLSSCGNWRVEQAVPLMERNISNPVSVSDIAAVLNTSERELNRAFNKVSNESPSTISRNMRLAHGHWLLLNTPRTITQISMECGFSDGAHFSRWFKRKYLESPGQFRTRRRGLQIPATHGTPKGTAEEPARM